MRDRIYKRIPPKRRKKEKEEKDEEQERGVYVIDVSVGESKSEDDENTINLTKENS